MGCRAEIGHRKIRTLERDVFSWSVERKLHSRVWREEAWLGNDIWTSLVVDEEGILGLGEWNCSLPLLVCVRIPDYLCRTAVNDTVGWADGIGVAIRGAKSGDGEARGRLYKVGKVPPKGDWVVCSDFIVGGSCRLRWLSERELPRRQRACYRCLRYTGCTGGHFGPSILFSNYSRRRRRGWVAQGRKQESVLFVPRRATPTSGLEFNPLLAQLQNFLSNLFAILSLTRFVFFRATASARALPTLRFARFDSLQTATTSIMDSNDAYYVDPWDDGPPHPQAGPSAVITHSTNTGE